MLIFMNSFCFLKLLIRSLNNFCSTTKLKEKETIALHKQTSCALVVLRLLLLLLSNGNGTVNKALSTWKDLTAPRPVQRTGIPATGV